MSSPLSKKLIKNVIEEPEEYRKRKCGQGDASGIDAKKPCENSPTDVEGKSVPQISYSAQVSFIPASKFGRGDRAMVPNTSKEKSSLPRFWCTTSPNLVCYTNSLAQCNSGLPTSIPAFGADFNHLNKLAGVVNNLPIVGLSERLKADGTDSRPTFESFIPISVKQLVCEQPLSSHSPFKDVAMSSNTSSSSANHQSTQQADLGANSLSLSHLGSTPHEDQSYMTVGKNRVFRQSPRSGVRSKADQIVKKHLIKTLDEYDGCPIIDKDSFKSDGTVLFRDVSLEFMVDTIDQQKLFLIDSIKTKLFPNWDKLSAPHRMQALFSKLKIQPRLIKSQPDNLASFWSYLVVEKDLMLLAGFYDSFVATDKKSFLVNSSKGQRLASNLYGLMQWHGSSVPFVARDDTKYLIRNLLRSLLLPYQSFTAAHFGVMCNSLCQSVPCTVMEVEALSKLVPQGFTITKSTRLVSLTSAEKIYRHVIRRHNFCAQKSESRVEDANSKKEKNDKGVIKSPGSVTSTKNPSQKKFTKNKHIFLDVMKTTPNKSSPTVLSKSEQTSTRIFNSNSHSPISNNIGVANDTSGVWADAKNMSGILEGVSKESIGTTHWKKACKQRAIAVLSSTETTPSPSISNLTPFKEKTATNVSKEEIFPSSNVEMSVDLPLDLSIVKRDCPFKVKRVSLSSAPTEMAPKVPKAEIMPKEPLTKILTCQPSTETLPTKPPTEMLLTQPPMKLMPEQPSTETLPKQPPTELLLKKTSPLMFPEEPNTDMLLKQISEEMFPKQPPTEKMLQQQPSVNTTSNSTPRSGAIPPKLLWQAFLPAGDPPFPTPRMRFPIPPSQIANSLHHPVPFFKERPKVLPHLYLARPIPGEPVTSPKHGASGGQDKGEVKCTSPALSGSNTCTTIVYSTPVAVSSLLTPQSPQIKRHLSQMVPWDITSKPSASGSTMKTVSPTTVYQSSSDSELVKIENRKYGPHNDGSCSVSLTSRQCYEVIKMFREQITQLSGQLKERDGQLKERDGQLKERDGQLKERGGQLKERDEKIRALEKACKEMGDSRPS